ncbi:MAG: transposase zinc-binding domain-containing protein [Bacillota bacterium]|nr:transposase zinc-binding domain-containing protein [Bacillota bacterium]MDW7684689.1 transposase zinc-binding domain-containing protein [Bacillota bacterium]
MSQVKPQFHIKDIFADHWGHFKKVNKHKVPTDLWDSIEESVSKMLSCGETQNGFARYVCPDCLEDKVLAFTCKSRFCNRCGRANCDVSKKRC